MSSRSKEKLTSAFRKIFKGTDKVDATDNNAAAAAAKGAAVAKVAPVAKGAAAKNPIPPVGAVGESPGKRMRRQDKKISPLVRAPIPEPNSAIRARRLMKEFKELQKTQNSKKDPVFTVELINDNLYEWHARLHVLDPDSKLAKDMIALNVPCILLHLSFPENFPFAPPFMRVVEPRIEKGFVMEGGAICMELLTPRGWASAYTVEALIMQFAASVVKGQGRIMRKRSTKGFNKHTAEESFRLLVKTHEKYGWVTPSLSDG